MAIKYEAEKTDGTRVEVGRPADRFQLSPAYTPEDSVAGSSVMRLVLLAVLGILAVAAAGSRPKRTLGVILRGLVDAGVRQATPKKESKVEKAKNPPPPTKIYLIPVPERDKKSQVQLFNTQTPYTTRPLPYSPSTENFVTSTPIQSQQKNNTSPEAKQFLIRILNEEGKSVMLKITGDDVQVKKRGNGYMIGVSHNEAKANINIELPEKTTMSKSELTQTTTNSIDKTTLPLYTRFPPNPEKYQLFDKGVTTPEKQSPSPIPPFPAYPYPIFLAPQFFQPLSFESRFHPQDVTQYPTTTTEKPRESSKQYFTPTKLPDVEDNRTNTTKKVTKPARIQVTVRVKGDTVAKETRAEIRTTTTERPTTQSMGYQYPTVDQGYHYPVEPRFQYPLYPEPNPPKYQQPYADSNPPRYQQLYPEQHRFQQAVPLPQPPRYQWYLEPPAPPQQGGQQPAQHSEYQQNNWNLGHFTPYPSYLQDTLSPPYLPNEYARSAGQAK